MLGGGVSASFDASLSAEVFLALLQIDEALGCVANAARRFRGVPEVRQVIAAQIIQPYVRRHTVMIDYDQPAARCLTPQEFDSIHPSLTAESFPIPNRGQQPVTIDEIYLGCSLTTSQYFRLYALTRRRPVCLVEEQAMIGSVLKDVAYPTKSHCGHPHPVRQALTEVATLLRFEGRRIATICRAHERYSQDYRLLAVPHAA